MGSIPQLAPRNSQLASRTSHPATRKGFVLVLVLVLVLVTLSYFACIFSLFENEDENDDEDDGFNPATRTSQHVTRNT